LASHIIALASSVFSTTEAALICSDLNGTLLVNPDAYRITTIDTGAQIGPFLFGGGGLRSVTVNEAIGTYASASNGNCRTASTLPWQQGVGNLRTLPVSGRTASRLSKMSGLR
jgi:hypothetical protein